MSDELTKKFAYALANIKGVLRDLWLEMFSEMDTRKITEKQPGLCQLCREKTKKEYRFTGYFLPGLFLRLFVCKKCFEVLDEQSLANSILTEKYFLSSIDKVRDETVKICLDYNTQVNVKNAEQLVPVVKVAMVEVLSDLSFNYQALSKKPDPDKKN